MLQINESTLVGIADAIRTKEGSEGLIPTTEMAERIANLPSGEKSLVDKLIYYNDFNGNKLLRGGWKETKLNSGSTESISTISVSGIQIPSAKALNTGYTNYVQEIDLSHTDGTAIETMTFGGWFFTGYTQFATPIMFKTNSAPNPMFRLYYLEVFNTDLPFGHTYKSLYYSQTSPYAWHTFVVKWAKINGLNKYQVVVDNTYVSTYKSTSTEYVWDLLSVSFGRTIYHPEQMTCLFASDEILNDYEIENILTNGVIL